MRRWICFCFVLFAGMLYTMSARALAAREVAGFRVEAQACALIDARSGRVLYQQNGDEPLPMASTTKVMTALLVLERGNLKDVVTIGAGASGIEGSSIYLEAGERLTVEQLLYGLLLRSGNDAALALAEHIGGSVENFVGMMNERARELGLQNTRFQNPHGLPAEDHYASAVDMGRIMAMAVAHEDFVRIATTKKTQIPWEGHPWNRVLTNKNRMLDDLEGCAGGKTGFTKEAGRCLVQAAERDGARLVSVVLNCPDWWNQTEKVLEYGFDSYREHVFMERGEWADDLATTGSPGAVGVVAGETLSVLVRDGEELALRLEVPGMPPPPYAAGQPVGEAVAVVNGAVAGRVPLVAAGDVLRNGYGDVVRRVFGGWM